MAYKAKQRELRLGRVSNNTIWDSLVFKRIQARFGGNLRFMITGAGELYNIESESSIKIAIMLTLWYE